MIRMVAFDLGHTILDEVEYRELAIHLRPAVPMQGVLAALPRIDLPMAIWANTTATGAEVRAWLKGASLDHYFRCIVTSAEVGYRKPDKRFFVRALTECGYGAHEILFVGNQRNSDIEGANACGIQSVLLTAPAYRSADDCGTANAEPTYEIEYLDELPGLLRAIAASEMI